MICNNKKLTLLLALVISGCNGDGDGEADSKLTLLNSEYFVNPANPMVAKVQSTETILELYGEKDSEGLVTAIDRKILYTTPDDLINGNIVITELPEEGVEITTLATGDVVTIDIREEGITKYTIEYIDGDVDIFYSDNETSDVEASSMSAFSSLTRNDPLTLREGSNSTSKVGYSSYAASNVGDFKISFEQCGMPASNLSNVSATISLDNISINYKMREVGNGVYQTITPFNSNDFSNEKLAKSFYNSLEKKVYTPLCAAVDEGGTTTAEDLSAKEKAKEIRKAQKELSKVVDKYAKKLGTAVAGKLVAVIGLYDWATMWSEKTECLLKSQDDKFDVDTGLYHIKNVLSDLVMDRDYKAFVQYTVNNGKRIQQKTWTPYETINITLPDNPNIKLIPPSGTIKPGQDYKVKAIASCSIGDSMNLSVSGTDGYKDNMNIVSSTDPYSIILNVPGAEKGVVDTLKVTSSNSKISTKKAKVYFR